MKTFTKCLVTSALLSIGGAAFAQVQLSVDENIKVTAINGQEINRGLFQPLQNSFTLEAGRHVITARYDRLFNLNNNNHDYLKSNNVTLTVDLQDNQTYQLVMPNQPNTYAAAKEFAKAPQLAVMLGSQVIAEQKTADDRSGLLSSLGGMFKRKDSAVIENQQAIAALPNASAQAQQAQKNNLDGFMELWLNANEEERKKIRQWIEQ